MFSLSSLGAFLFVAFGIFWIILEATGWYRDYRNNFENTDDQRKKFNE